MTAKGAIKESVSDMYAEIYSSRYKSVARQAFIDGMTFCSLVQKGAVLEGDLNIEYFKRLNEMNSL